MPLKSRIIHNDESHIIYKIGRMAADVTKPELGTHVRNGPENI